MKTFAILCTNQIMVRDWVRSHELIFDFLGAIYNFPKSQFTFGRAYSIIIVSADNAASLRGIELVDYLEYGRIPLEVIDLVRTRVRF